MAGKGFGKNILDDESTSSSSAVPLVVRKTQPQKQIQSSPKTQTSMDANIPRKAINILRSEGAEYRRMAKNKLLAILMEKPNPDAGKDVVVDIDSEDEFQEVVDQLNKDQLPLKKKMFMWKADNYYRTDPEFQKVSRSTHQSVSYGTRAPDELKSLLSLEYSHYIVEKYNVKVPQGWMLSIPTERERICLFQYNKMGLYPDAFHFGMRLPFNPFIKDVFNYFNIAPSQITPNSWRMLRAFEAICYHLATRPTARSFHFFFCIKKGMTDWAYFSKRGEFDNFRMMGGLDESVQDWKEYFWKVTVDATETRFDFHSSWSRPIHKGGLPYKLLGLNDKATVSKIQKFVPEYIQKYGTEYDELDSAEIVKRYLNDDFIFELPEVLTQAEGCSADISNCNQSRP